jgi:hypothetical protein
MVNAIVVGDLLPLGDPPLGNHEDLVAVRVDPQGVRLTRVVQQQQGGEHRASHLANTKTESVLRFHYILVWICIRGSMPLIDGSGSGYCYFYH